MLVLLVPAAHGQNLKRSRKTKGRASKILESRILRLQKEYQKLTVRQFYYIMISSFRYPPGRQFYKRFVYHLSKLRRTHLDLHAKIIDPTRQFIPASPIAFREIELWVEKDAIRMQVEDLAARYRISIQVLRGFGSLTVYRNALERAAKSGVKKILYVGDLDPSGVLIERVAARELGIKIQRVALTRKQARRFHLKSIKVNRNDSRAMAFAKKYGSRAWELEALKPRTFTRILERSLRENVPRKFLIKAVEKERAARIAKPLAGKIVKNMEREVLRMLRSGKSEREIRRIIARKFGPGGKE